MREDSNRITISIGLIAIFLTLIFSLHNFLPKENFSAIQFIIGKLTYSYFLITMVFFFIFLFLKAHDLKNGFHNKINLIIFKVNLPIGISEMFYNLGVNLALFSPFLTTFMAYIIFFPDWLMNKFILKEIWSEIIGFVLLLIILFSSNYLINKWNVKTEHLI